MVELDLAPGMMALELVRLDLLGQKNHCRHQLMGQRPA